MRVSAAAEKLLMMEEEMEILTEFQVKAGLGFCLRVLQLLWMKVSAVITLERLWLCSRRLMMRAEDGSAGTAVVRFMILVGSSLMGRDAQLLIGQDDLGWGRKLPCNQKSDLIWSQVERVLMSKSAGLRGHGHQNQQSDEDVADISISLVPKNTGGLAGSFLAIILRTISETPINTGGERDTLDNSWLIFCSILVARTAPAISDWGAEKADFPIIFAELERRLN